MRCDAMRCHALVVVAVVVSVELMLRCLPMLYIGKLNACLPACVRAREGSRVWLVDCTGMGGFKQAGRAWVGR
ncbi:hypothetical protein LZ31DRAFT_194647 [Colletotrichum somersetense]|nr:hypothetical protein LZ31DRAFT_194647 [Colletotrichum somersetense]